MTSNRTKHSSTIRLTHRAQFSAFVEILLILGIPAIPIAITALLLILTTPALPHPTASIPMPPHPSANVRSGEAGAGI